ncbi:unnamed protein product [Musa textilis]
MAARVLRSSLKDASFNKLKLRCGVGPRRYSTASEAAGRAAPEIPHSSKKVSSAFLELIDGTWCSAH